MSDLTSIEEKLTSIEGKIDRFLERITTVEVKQGMVATGLIVLVAPALVGLIIYLFTK